MYRLAIHWLDDEKTSIRVTHRRSGRQWERVVLSGIMKRSVTPDQLSTARAYGMQKAIREVFRDLLYEQFGRGERGIHRFRIEEARHWPSLFRSMVSSVKRAR